MAISVDIEQVVDQLKETLDKCFDVTTRRLSDYHGRSMAIIYADGLVNKQTIQDDIIRPLLGFSFDIAEKQLNNFKDLLNLVSAVDVKEEPDFNAAIRKCLSGDTVLFIDGCERAVVIQTRGWQSRGISQPDTQKSIRGPKEGFTETMLFNVSMLRRKIRTPLLKTEIVQVGDLSCTDICVMYVEGLVEKKIVDEVLRRLKQTNVAYVLESGHIEQLIEDNHKTIYPTMAANEKPDVVAGKLMKGRVAIIVDGTPFVLTVPMLFTESFQSGEDYYMRPYYANFLRILRIIAYLVTIILPALYVALVNFHQHMIPEGLLAIFMEANQGTPLGLTLEMTFMLVVYMLLQEAMLRMPAQIGAAVGMVGVFIIGDAAVGVKLIGAPTVVIAAITFICSAVVNSAAESTGIIRFGLLFLAATLGIHGILLGIFVMIAHLCTLKSFGKPYMIPLAPFKVKGLRDGVLRADIHQVLERDSE